jgi:hypothetical protein
MPSISTKTPRSSGKRRRPPAPRERKATAPDSETFGEWARRVAGMVKSGWGDLSTLGRFGDSDLAPSSKKPFSVILDAARIQWRARVSAGRDFAM